MILAIDFDVTIVDHEYPLIGKLKPNAKEIINKLYNDGYKIIIWTCRYVDKDILLVKEFLSDNKIQYHKINENIECNGFNPYPKVYADLYIDDKNLCGIPNWIDIYNIIKNSIYVKTKIFSEDEVNFGT
jgi:hypothetical protein